MDLGRQEVGDRDLRRRLTRRPAPTGSGGPPGGRIGDLATTSAPRAGSPERELRIRLALGAIVALAGFGALWRLSRPDWKVDESLDGAFAWEAVRHGTWSLEDGHPVFVRWFLGAGQLAFGQDRLGIRIAPAIASIAAVVLLYVVGRALAGWRTGLLAAAMWAVLPRALVLGHDVVGPLRGDRYGYLEPFMVVVLLGATLTGWRWVQRAAWPQALATGVLVGLAAAFKPTAVVVLLPIVATAAIRHRSLRTVGPQATAIAGLAVATFVVTYLPLGTDAPSHIGELFRYQLDHARTGHVLVVDGQATTSQPRWAHLLYQWRGMGPLACLGLLVGFAGAVADHRRPATRYVAAIWATLLGFHVLSAVALPHYYLLWAPVSVLLAAMGLVHLLAPVRTPTVRALGAAGVALLAAAGIVGLVDVATVDHGDYGRLVAELDRRGIEPTAVRYQGEAVDRYFPNAPAGQIGFSDPNAPFDLLVLDPRDVPMLPAGAAGAERARAAAAGLAEHRIGRLEVWFREQPADGP
ncbi:MAG: glycosyltransferase family 39 protein [Acidimicrobiales bacterium]